MPAARVTAQPAPGAFAIAPFLDAAPDLDLRFRDRTEAGRAALAAGDASAARAPLLEAWDEAEAQFERAREGCTAAMLVAPMMLVLAGHNLIEARRLAGEAAGDAATSAVERLLAAAACPATPLALRLNSVRHLRRALDLLGRTPEAEAVIRSIGPRVAAVAEEVIRVAGLCADRRGGGAGAPS